MHVLWCETFVEMDPLFKERMTAIATAKAASTKSCVLSQEKFEAIVHHLSSPQDKVDPHFKHWVKSRNFQLADLPGLGLFKVLVIPNERNNKVCLMQLHTLVSLVRNFKPIILGGWCEIIACCKCKSVIYYRSGCSCSIVATRRC